MNLPKKQLLFVDYKLLYNKHLNFAVAHSQKNLMTTTLIKKTLIHVISIF